MFLEKVINHFNNYMIISNITLYIMSAAILLMSLVFMFHLLFKKQLLERNILISGILARVLMFAGFTIEFAHQMTTYNRYTPIYNAKWDAVVQLVHFLFWGYIAVVGVYYLFVMGIKKYRGLIYTFDIAMMSIPLIFGIVLGVFEGLYNGGIESLLLIPLPAACLFVFFQCYWRRKPRYYIAFFITSIISLACAYKFKSLKLMLPFSAFIILLGIYQLMMADIQLKKYREILLVLPIAFIFSANPFYNLWIVVESGQTYTVTNIFYKDVKNVSPKEIEKRVRAALENDKDKLEVKKVSNAYISKAYELQLGGYNIYISGVDGNRILIEKKDSKSKITDDIGFDGNLLREKSLSILNKLGYTYNSNTTEIKEKVEKGQYIVTFYRKFDDGSLYNSMLPASEFKWDANNELKFMKVVGVFDIKDYSTVKISETQIKEILNNFYKKINKIMLNYVITYVGGTWRENISIECDNKDSFELDAVNGEILSYISSSPDSAKYDKTEEGIIKNRERAINYAKAISSFWDKGVLKETELGKSYAYGQYNFIGYIPSGKVTIETLINENGELEIFTQNITPDKKVYSNKEFKITRKEAIKLVEQNYNPFKIYTTKAALVLTSDDYFNTELKWRVGVVPFLSSEKHYYLVDVNTGSIEPVGDYGKGE